MVAYILSSAQESDGRDSVVWALHGAARTDLIDTSACNIRVSARGNYTDAKNAIVAEREKIRARYSVRPKKDSLYIVAKAALEEHIVNRIIPFWYGTAWDFYGYSSRPGQGKIACGYFVSTVLLHSGFNLNRYTLAQQAPINEAMTVAYGDSVSVYEAGFPGFSDSFKKRNPEGLYFVGLDNHVGFLLYRHGELLFIHSSYLSPLCVVIEKAKFSSPFNMTSTYRVAPISTNKSLIDAWISGTKINTRTP